MEYFLWVVFGVVIAATIGGLTNYMAIKMLFHPRRPILIKGKRLPFTPGLIPKRKEEIARSLGTIVGEHLVTSAGLRSVLQSSQFQARLERVFYRWIDRYEQSEWTVQEELLRLLSPEQLEHWKLRLDQWGRDGVSWGIRSLWEYYEIESRTVAQWLTLIPQARLDLWKRQASLIIIQTLREQLHSRQGEDLIKRAVDHFIGKQTGFFGTLAGAMIDTHKLTRRIQASLVETLAAEETAGYIVELLDAKLNDWRDKRLDELIRPLLDEDPLAWLIRNVLSRIGPTIWLESILEQPMNQLTARWREPLREKVPIATSWLLKQAGEKIERWITAFDLPGLVQSEVNHFPIERVEQVILAVTGREFRAITWLGAIIGGAIGLAQSFIYLTLLG